jgi:hypothetical protein
LVEIPMSEVCRTDIFLFLICDRHVTFRRENWRSPFNSRYAFNWWLSA